MLPLELLLAHPDIPLARGLRALRCPPMPFAP